MDIRNGSGLQGSVVNVLSCVVLTTQYTNLSPLVAGLPIRLSGRHAKVRRDGYHG
jgi:hypothetical protein